MSKSGLSTPRNFPSDRSMVVFQFQFCFVCMSVTSFVTFFLLFSSLSLLFWVPRVGGLCFVIVAFPGYLHLYFCVAFGLLALCTIMHDSTTDIAVLHSQRESLVRDQPSLSTFDKL